MLSEVYKEQITKIMSVLNKDIDKKNDKIYSLNHEKDVLSREIEENKKFKDKLMKINLSLKKEIERYQDVEAELDQLMKKYNDNIKKASDLTKENQEIKYENKNLKYDSTISRKNLMSEIEENQKLSKDNLELKEKLQEMIKINQIIEEGSKETNQKYAQLKVENVEILKLVKKHDEKTKKSKANHRIVILLLLLILAFVILY